ncbi:MAG: GrpB family protein [Actinomycetales bacterium]
MPAVEIVAHRSDWRREFEEAREALLEVLAGLSVGIEHIGSTSVPGLPAKDVIDMQVCVPDEDALAGAVERLQGHGYPVRFPVEDHPAAGADPDPAQWHKAFTRETPGGRRCNIHIRVEGRENWRYALLFRDFLRAHPDMAAAYAAFKTKAAALVPDDVDVYADLKDPVCDLVYLPALSWAAATGWQGPLERNVQQPVSISREALAGALRQSTDPLAREALVSLDDEVRAEVALWNCNRADLLAVYQERADRGRRGQGPATRRTDEYVAVLSAPSTPEELSEAGWASGSTFFVTLLHEGSVLAICTVARAVWPLDEGLENWHAFGTGSGFEDIDLIKNALDVVGSDTDPQAFGAVRPHDVTCRSPRPESADAWYQASTPSGIEVAAIDHSRARLYLSRT